MVKTAIVILNWNGQDLLREFLPSVINNSSTTDTKIIIADNGSNDDSIKLLKDDFPAVEVLDLKQNHGFAKGYNEALKQIDAEYYVLLNSDVEVSENWLLPVIDLFEKHADIGAIQPKILSFNRKEYFEYAGASGGFIDRYGFPFCRGRILNELEKDEGQYDQSDEIFWASGACMFIRANVFHQAGGFDADFWAHMEEIDLCWRIKNMGYRVFFCPESIVYHLGGGTLSYDNPRKLYLNFRNNLSLLYKNLPTKKLVPTMFSRMIFDTLAAFRLLTERNAYGFFSVIRAHISFYKNLPRLRKKRKAHSQFLIRTMHPEIFKGSIIWQFYMKSRKRFNELEF